MRLRLAGFTVTAALAMATLANAQPQGRATGAGKGAPPIGAAQTYLELSDSHQAIRQNARTAAEPIFEQLRTKQEALGAAMNTTPVNAATVTALRAEITGLWTRLDSIEASARAQMAATLDAAALRKEAQGAPGMGLLDGGGPGSPGGRGKGF